MSATTAPKILAFAGSLRQDSWNKKLLKIAVDAASAAGAEVELIDLGDHELPLFSEDLEIAGIPDALVGLRTMFDHADGLMIASPEYNGSVTAVLKNTIDWLSRSPRHGEDYQPSYKDKSVAIMGTSPGRMGGKRSAKHLAEILAVLGCTISSEPVSVPSASHVFDEEGKLNDPEINRSVVGLAELFVQQLQDTLNQ